MADTRKVGHGVTEQITVREQPHEAVVLPCHGDMPYLGELHEGAHILQRVGPLEGENLGRHEITDINHIDSP